jgi:NADH-quinone oxidoreductase subunit N
MTIRAVELLTPEITLIAGAVAIYLGGTFRSAPKAWRWIGGAAIAIAAALLANQSADLGGGPVHLDALAGFGRWLALGLGAALVLVASRPLGGVSNSTPEYVGSLLVAIAGLMLTSEAADLVLLFVGLELVSIPTYVLLYLGRRDAACQESAAKYFFLSVLSSAVLLYGFSFLYGIAGSTELATARASFENIATLPGGFAAFARLAMILIFASLAFKIAAAPFHFYAPDVYQGTTNPNAAMLSVVPKAAGLVALVRLIVETMPGLASYSWLIVVAVSALTMTWANVTALWQDDLRRLLAYSSIAHAGYMLMGLAAALATQGAAPEWDGLAAMWFYLIAYAAATIGVLAVAESLGSADRRIDAIDELAGLGRSRPWAAAAMATCLFSLAGVPPLAGFWGKLFLFGSALDVGNVSATGAGPRVWFVGLAILGVLNAAVAAAYYLRIVAVMYFHEPSAAPPPEGGRGAWIAAVVCSLVVVAIGVYPGALARQAGEVSRSSRVADALSSLAQPQMKEPPPQPAPRSGMAAIDPGEGGTVHLLPPLPFVPPNTGIIEMSSDT